MHSRPSSSSARRATCLALSIVTALLACGGTGDTAREGSGGGPISGVPAQFAPSEPGYLDVRPDGRVLLPGQSVQLAARVFDGDAPPVAPVGTKFTSETPEIVTVDASGVVTARAVGIGEVVVEDAGRRQRAVFVPVLVATPIGASGGAVDVAMAEGAAVLTAKTPGLVELTATTAGGTLFGRLLVSVFDPAVPHAVGCEDAEWYFGGCWLDRPPLVFTMPGVTDVLRVELLEHRRCGPKACGRFGPTSCPATYQGKGASFEATLACICNHEPQLRTCCKDASEAIGARTWTTTSPTLLSFIGKYDAPEAGVPVFCGMIEGDCNARTAPEEREACAKIVRDLEACNTQHCAISQWETYADACEGEAEGA